MFKRVPYAVLVMTLAFVLGATWLATHMSSTTILLPTETFSSYTTEIYTPEFYLTNYNTYWIGARDGIMYIHNNMDYVIQTYQLPTFPTDHNSYKPFIKFEIAQNIAISAKNDVENAMRNSYATINDVMFYLMTYNPVIVGGVDPQIIAPPATTVSAYGVLEVDSSKIIQWTYSNTKIQTLYSYLYLNAEQIDPLIYYRAAYEFEQLQMAKLAAFYYRYNVFLNLGEAIYLGPGTYTFNSTSTITITESSSVLFYYDYGNTTTYPNDATIAYPLFFNNQVITIKEYQAKYYSPTFSITYTYEISVTGDPYPPYDTFTDILKAVEIILQNYGPNDALQLYINTSTLGLITNMIFYTYKNELYPTALIYAYTGVSPEPFPAFNDAYLSADTDVTLYEYFMPIYPAFIIPYSDTINASIINSNISTVSSITVAGGGNLIQSFITYYDYGAVTFTATIPLIISKGEATKIIEITVIPEDNTGTSWTTTITTTYRCISQRTVSITVTAPFTITTVTSTVLTKNFYMLITISEKFPLYPTVPLYNVDAAGTTYVRPLYTTTTTTKQLVFTTYIATTTVISGAGGTYTSTYYTTSLTTITITFTTTKFLTITTFLGGNTLTATTPMVFEGFFTEVSNKMTAGLTTTTIVHYFPSPSATTVTVSSSTDTITIYNVWSEPTIWFYTKITKYTTNFTMEPAPINSLMKSIAHFFTVPTDAQMTMFYPTLLLSQTVTGTKTSYVVSLTVSATVYTNTTSVTEVTRIPYVTAVMLVARYTFDTSSSVTVTISTETNIIHITINGVPTQITSYAYTTLETTYYWTTMSANTLKISYSTVLITPTTVLGMTFINQTLTTSIDTYAIVAMSEIYIANRSIALDGEILATRIAANNLLVGYAELDNYDNLVNIRGQWIITPLPMYFSSYEMITLSTTTTYPAFPGTGTTTDTIIYNSYKLITAILAIDTGYIDPFEALLFKAPASPLDLYTSLLKINYPGIYGLDYTTYFLITTNGTEQRLTSKVYTSAAAFLLLTETANPQDNIVVQYIYAQFTTEPYYIIPAGVDFVIGSVILPQVITITVNTTTTYPVVQYYLSSVPYVYILPIPTMNQTVYLKYTLTLLSYNELGTFPYIINTTEIDVTNTYFVYTSEWFGTLFPASSIVAYVSPAWMGIYLLYGMESTTLTQALSIVSDNNTIITVTAYTGSYWIDDSWFVPWLQEIYIPVTATTTIIFQTYISGTITTSTLTGIVTVYALQIYQDIELPNLTFNASDGTTLDNFGDLISYLSLHSSYIVNPTNNAIYLYSQYLINNKPIYIISGATSSVVYEYITRGTVPIIFVPSVNGTSVSIVSSYLPDFFVAKYTSVEFTRGLWPEATIGWTDSTSTPAIVQFYYEIPFYAAFYNMPMYAGTVTSLPLEWYQAPDVMYMYIPWSSTMTITYAIVTTNSYGLPEIVSSTTMTTVIWYGTVLPYTFTSVTVGESLYSYNPLSTTTSSP